MVGARGMTLVEVMVALLVSVVGLVGALAMMGTLLSGSGASRAATEASTLAQQAIESWQSAPTASLPADKTLTIECLDTIGNDGGALTTTAGNACANSPPTWYGCKKYERDITWSTVATQSTRTILVQVCWQDAFGAIHRISQQGTRNP